MKDGLDGKIAKANREAARRIFESRCFWTDVKPAIEVVKGMTANTIFHAGPPVSWDRMAGPLKGSIIAAMLFEGLARTSSEAIRLAKDGKVNFGSSLDRNAISCGCGATSASMLMFEVKNKPFGKTAYIALPELGLLFGRYDKKTVEHLRWMKNVLGPTLKDAVRDHGPLEIEPILAQALLMGDECHDRAIAATCLFERIMAPSVVSVADRKTAREVLRNIGEIDLFFLWPIMAKAKATADAAHGVEYSTVMTTLSGNGTEMGVRISGLGHEWYKAPSPRFYVAKYFPGFSDSDSNPEVGDSVMVDMLGLGGGCMAAGLAHVLSTGETVDDALRYTREMLKISVARNDNFKIPMTGFKGAPTGYDMRRILKTGIAPVLAVGIAHKEAGKGFIGFGMTRVPMECVKKANEAFAAKYGASAA